MFLLFISPCAIVRNICPALGRPLFLAFLRIFAGVVLSGRESEPAGKMFFGWPPGQIIACFGQQLHPGIIGDPRDDCSIFPFKNIDQVRGQFLNSRSMVPDRFSFFFTSCPLPDCPILLMTMLILLSHSSIWRR